MFTTARQRHLFRACDRCSAQVNNSTPRTVYQRHRQSSTTSTSSPSSSPSEIPKQSTVFSGIQPTGVPHLGNYLGALRPWVELQHSSPSGTRLIYSVVDLHALTGTREAATLRQRRRETLAILLAVGIDPEKATLFFQSDVPAHSELMWIFSTTASMGYLSRMTQWKSKLSVSMDASLDDSDIRSRLKLGLFSYPVLQAADILVHRANYVPVGSDQKQHIEFSREVAKGFNHLFGPVLTVPEPLISEAKRVMSLRSPEKKMSKSSNDERSMILLTDSPDTIRNKLRLSVTDSDPSVTYNPSSRPAVANLLEILSHIETASGRSVQEIAADEKLSSLKALKGHLSDQLVSVLSPIRERYLELMAEDERASGDGYLESVARKGAKEATANAEITMTSVKKAIGLM